jgi:hypothetical protein
MTYRNVVSAVVRALAAETINRRERSSARRLLS